MSTQATTTALLKDLSDPANHEVWAEFDGRYRPVLHAFARRLGLNEVDAADAAQEALSQFVRAYRDGRYDRSRGRLSSWLIGIARHCILDVIDERSRRRPARGMSAVVELPDEHRMTIIFDEECRRVILQKSMLQLKTETRLSADTIRTFEMLTFHQMSPAQVASELNTAEADVYLAKHRCLKRLRTIVADLEAAFEVQTEL